jgi:signal transduction histidine kinase
MSPHYPPSVRRRVDSSLFFRGLHVVGLVCIGGSFLLVESLQVTEAQSELWPALLAMVPMALLLAHVDGSRTVAAAVAYLLVGCAVLFVVAGAVVSQIPVADASGTYPLALLKIALIVVGGPARKHAAAAAWPVAGLVAGELAVGTATVLADGALELDLTALTAAVTVVVLRMLVLGAEVRETPARDLLGHAASEEAQATDRARTEMRAAALLHDTVLNDLSTVASAHTGSLQPELRSRLMRDLSLLSGGQWRGGETAVAEMNHSEMTNLAEVVAVVASARELGLKVDVVGDFAVGRDLSPERMAAVALAVHQCLNNIAKHSGTTHAEIVIASSLGEVSVMVIDSGKGFAVHETDENRLGLRQSVIRTVEDVGGSVRIWSAPGRGTSVMLRLPLL